MARLKMLDPIDFLYGCVSFFLTGFVGLAVLFLFVLPFLFAVTIAVLMVVIG